MISTSTQSQRESSGRHGNECKLQVINYSLSGITRFLPCSLWTSSFPLGPPRQNFSAKLLCTIGNLWPCSTRVPLAHAKMRPRGCPGAPASCQPKEVTRDRTPLHDRRGAPGQPRIDRISIARRWDSYAPLHTAPPKRHHPVLHHKKDPRHHCPVLVPLLIFWLLMQSRVTPRPRPVQSLWSGARHQDQKLLR